VNATNAVLSENFYWRAQPEHEDDFQALNTLPEATVEIKATKKFVKGKCLLNVSLHNTAPVVALMTHLQLRQADGLTRALPVYYSDNYISLLPGETRTITIEAAIAQSGNDPVLMVDGWNVTVKETAAQGEAIRIAANKEAHAVSMAGVAPQPLEGVRINCGGIVRENFRFGAAPAAPAPAPGVFQSDNDFAGGDVASTKNTIDTSASGAAPQAVYQAERWGESTYAFNMKPGQDYTVRLHFAETKFEPGQRKFHVEINGREVLRNHDIGQDARGPHKVRNRVFRYVVPDADGRL